MGKFDFDDDEQEPTFSLHDFKKWLSKQGDGEGLSEHVKKKESAEDLKETFKERVRRKRRKKD